MLGLKIKTAENKSSYAVTIAKDFSAFTDKILPFISGEKVAVITDSVVNEIYPDVFSGYLKNKTVYKYVVSSGEESKNIDTFAALLNNLAEDGFTREDTVLTFGGGVVGDLGGFVAATYMRGVNLISVPTTLLSMADSSVGGKTAINLNKGKNLCGAFYSPKAVYINVGFLKTLPHSEMLNGYGEMLKYTFLSDFNFDGETVDESAIYECLKIKAAIVTEDEREKGIRKLLNFGHTVGHAIEKLSDFKLPHGICVAKGIDYALKISEKYFGYGDERRKEYEKKAGKLGVDCDCAYSAESLFKTIVSDKKRFGSEIDIILINKNGKAEIVRMKLDLLREYL